RDRRLGQPRGGRARGARTRARRGAAREAPRAEAPLPDRGGGLPRVLLLRDRRGRPRSVAPGAALPHPSDVRGRALARALARQERVAPDPPRREPRAPAPRGAFPAERSRAGIPAPGVTMDAWAAAFPAADYKSELKPIWCPACGDYGVVQAIYRALAAIGR